jgi:outer membrane protein assembly factor BamB
LFLAVDVGAGKPVFQQPIKSYAFSSPAVAGDVVYVGVLNGTLEARDLKTGDLLWDFQTEASRRNAGWALTADRKLNAPLLFASNWSEGPTVGAMREFSVGSIFSSPLIVSGVVYVGSADGFVYALD